MENLQKNELDKFSEKNAPCVGHNMQANTISLRRKNTVMSGKMLFVGQDMRANTIAF